MIDPWFPIIAAPRSALYPPKVDLWVHDQAAGGYRVTDAFWQGGAWRVKILFGIKVRAFPATHIVTHYMRRPAAPDAASGQETV